MKGIGLILMFHYEERSQLKLIIKKETIFDFHSNSALMFKINQSDQSQWNKVLEALKVYFYRFLLICLFRVQLPFTVKIPNSIRLTDSR